MTPLDIRRSSSRSGAATTLQLPDGSTLEVRAVTPADTKGLAELYGSLSIEDLHLRFFSVYHPPEEVLRRWTRLEETGGFGLVAELDTGGGRIVGHASYALLPDGDGDFAITVAPGWRGWLGPYLLDALAAVAAERGVPNLEGDILVENRRMLSLVRARGYATIDEGDWTVMRVLIGTSGKAPTWPGPHEGPRVLVEAPGGRSRMKEAARALGMQVVSCSGPAPRHHNRCPAVTGEPCPLASGADVILFGLSSEDEGACELLRAHSRLHKAVRLCVLRSGAEPEEVPLPNDAVLVDPDTSGDDLAALLRDVAAGDPAEDD